MGRCVDHAKIAIIMNLKVPKLNQLIQAIESDEKMNPGTLAKVLKEINLSTEDLHGWKDYNHPKTDGYGRKMVYEGKNFEVMVMSWNPGDISSIHNHGYTEWGVVQVFGKATHLLYSFHNDELKFAKREILTSSELALVNNGLIHQMGNLSEAPYLSLHIYGTENTRENITADARIFEPENGLIKYTTGGAFFNLSDKEISATEPLKMVEKNTWFEFLGTYIPYLSRYDDSYAAKKIKDIAERTEVYAKEPCLS